MPKGKIQDPKSQHGHGLATKRLAQKLEGLGKHLIKYKKKIREKSNGRKTGVLARMKQLDDVEDTCCLSEEKTKERRNCRDTVAAANQVEMDCR